MTELRLTGQLLQLDTERRTVAGLVVPFGQVIDHGWRERITFAPGSLTWADDTKRVKLLTDHDAGRPVGYATQLAEQPDGVHATFHLPPGDAGDAALSDAAAGLRDGLSVGVELTTERPDPDTGATVLYGRLREVSLVAVPAFDDARVTRVAAAAAHAETLRRDAPDMEPTTELAAELTTAAPVDTAARETLTQLATRVGELELATVRVREPHPLARYSRPGEFLLDYANGFHGDAAARDRALAFAAGTGTIGSSDGVDAPAWLGEIVARVAKGRPTVTAAGVRRLPDSGMTLHWPEVTSSPVWAAQQNELTDVRAGAFTLEDKTTPVKTFVAGIEASLQVVQRSDPDFLDALMGDLAEGYAQATASSLMVSLAAATQTAEFPAVISDVSHVSSVLASCFGQIATGAGSLDVITLAPGLFAEVAVVAGNGMPFAGGNVGNATLASPSFVALGVQFVADANLTADTGYAFNRDSVAFWESPGAPFNLSQTVPANLSQSIAAYGYGTSALKRAGGVVKLTRASAAARSTK